MMNAKNNFYKVLAEGMMPYLINRPDTSLESEGGQANETND
ncbi:hypothetical protein [Enterococcus bulliens]